MRAKPGSEARRTVRVELDSREVHPGSLGDEFGEVVPHGGLPAGDLHNAPGSARGDFFEDAGHALKRRILSFPGGGETDGAAKVAATCDLDHERSAEGLVRLACAAVKGAAG